MAEKTKWAMEVSRKERVDKERGVLRWDLE